MKATHKLVVAHNDWPAGTLVELKSSRKDESAPSGWYVLVRAADRQRKGKSWPEFQLDSKEIERLNKG